MKIHFYVRYTTKPGQNLAVNIQFDGQTEQLPLDYLDDTFWHGTFELGQNRPATIRYHYICNDPGAIPALRSDWDSDRHLDLADFDADLLQVTDNWNPAGAVENAFATQPFREILLKNKAPEAAAAKPGKHFTHIFRVKAPVLGPDESVCLLGHGKGLREWDTLAPLTLHKNGNWWEIRLDLSREDFPLGYKYGVWNRKTHRFAGFEEGSNRTLPDFGLSGRQFVQHDGFVRLPFQAWRGAGVAIPVFSLRSERGFGVGEFADLPALADWAKSVGLKLIQLLPINDTSATHTWTDSYPYAAISAFALHPIYVNLEAVAGKKHAALLKPFSKKQKELNALEAIDYEGVMQVKWAVLRQIFDLEKTGDWSKGAEYKTWFAENKHWLVPYAAFCFLRDQNGTSDFGQWSSNQVFDPKKVEKLVADEAEAQLHLFVQWHLHLQLKSAVDYAHRQGLVLKGDIPIGIYRYSCDAWVAPELYNMGRQAGAPPDDFAEKGQNWGFPTYNWQRMKADGFAWWRHRFAQMSLYFDAFRIDHILGFFRIWSIPLDAVEGIMGQFSPALPVHAHELYQTGLDRERLCRPYITDAVLHEVFGGLDRFVKEQFLLSRLHGRYDLKPEFATQRQVEKLDFETLKKMAGLDDGQVTDNIRRQLDSIKEGLYTLISNVLMFESPDAAGDGHEFHFRFGIEKTSSFRALDARQQGILKNLYVDYFYRRQDDFWQAEAMDKLPDLKRATDMLICGEDLGMVPHCVPDVMRELGILSLEIQRMPKASGATFFHPKDAPYLAVVTPSTHDMSTIRGWWEEDRQLSQRFYNEQLGAGGEAPYFCEPWVNRAILEQHFRSPAMWAIFQIQDLLGMDGKLRRENPNDERINVPANPKHYWRYRMHRRLEDLQKMGDFNSALAAMVTESGR